MTRTVIAFLIAPLVAPAILVPYFAADLSARWIEALAVIGIVFSYLGTIILGIPIYRYLRSKGWLSIWHAIGAGFVCGWLLWFFFRLLLSLSLGTDFSRAVDYAVEDLGNISHVWPSCVAGAGCGLVFWLISRPDRTPSPASGKWA